ncbi:serine/threonine-protein kinase Chk1-like [Oratosquilla oratoria]|uniref:serine/threonine-protein kinase Chk1-like n=1 Tax=Oratosquilla oratoria TaxID=337810 RepID=UPI003F768B69
MFLIPCCRRRKSSSKVAESRQIGESAWKWVSIVKKLNEFGSALRRCASEEPKGQTPDSSEDVPPKPVTKKPSGVILRENKLAVGSFKTSDWSVVRELGRGAFGSVQLLENRKTQELVARKSVPSKSKPSPVREAVIHVQLQHENIVRLVCWTKTSIKVFLLMEYCSGGTLYHAIDKIPQENVGKYFSQLMSAVNYLHSRGIAHRDLKPDNLILTEREVLKVADLGFAAVFIVNGKEVRLKKRVGTRPYMAPEVLRSRKYAGPPTDLWSCGIILFNMVSKNWPWRIAHLHDSDYKKWAEQDEVLRQMPKWRKITESSWRTHLETLLSLDPQERLSSWRKTLSHH